MTTYTMTADIPYGRDPRQRLDLYVPASPNGAALVDIHGGGWWQGDKGKEAHLATTLANAGYVVAVPNYRFADGQAKTALYPAQVDDMSAALAWLRGSDQVFDRSRVGVFGTSSGGNLAAETGIRHGIPAVSWSGLIDLEGFMRTHPDVVPRQAMINESTASAAIDQDGANNAYYAWLVINLLGGDMSRLHEATPLSRVAGSTGPMFLANSMAELVPPTEVTRMQAALTDAGVPSQTMLFEGSRHAEGYFDDAIAQSLAFLARYLA